MSIPEFTAQISLYRTNNRYRFSSANLNDSVSPQSVIAAYFPGPETQAACDNCLDGCAQTLAQCSLIAGAPLLACIFPPLCPGAAAVAGAALAACDLNSLACIGRCQALHCCPKACGTPNPLDPGEGCCDKNEQCVDRFDSNSRQGCCPSGQSVCDGKCCAEGERCCGDTCCPPNYFCRDGGFCSEFPSDFPHTPPPRPPAHSCTPGATPCGFPDSSGVIRTCCPPGLQCCSYSAQFGPECKTSCLH